MGLHLWPPVPLQDLPEPLLGSKNLCMGLQPVVQQLDPAGGAQLAGSKRRREQLLDMEDDTGGGEEAEPGQDNAAADTDSDSEYDKPLAARKRAVGSRSKRSAETGQLQPQAAPVAFGKVMCDGEVAIRVPVELLHATLFRSSTPAAGAAGVTGAGDATAAAAAASLADQVAAVDAVRKLQLRVLKGVEEVEVADIMADIGRVRKNQPVEPGFLYRLVLPLVPD